ncbi:MAG: hypothetical protein K2X77_31800, partial [Candidatus Obscuribacterales bacterium]|nr:hypothetical protein [Candidatus Obscuribacterales bacterium]
AADKAAADKAAADKAAADKAAADKAAADKAAAESAESSFRGLDVRGEWDLVNTHTTNQARVNIEQSNTYITAIISAQGNNYIPVGQVRFKGDYNANPFAVTVQRAYPGFTNPYWESGLAVVQDINNIFISAKTGNLTLKRSTPMVAPTEPAAPSETGTSTTIPSTNAAFVPYPITRRIDPSPKAAPGEQAPSADFLKKIQDAYAKLPDEVKQLLRENGYVITVAKAPWLAEEQHAFGYADKKDQTIHVFETTLDDADQTILAKDFYDDFGEILTHEVGHALDFILGLTTDPKFVEAWKKDIDFLNQDNLLKEFVGGEGGGKRAFTNEELQFGIPKGALETAAELMSYILGSTEEVAEHVKNASDNTYQYLKGKMLW